MARSKEDPPNVQVDVEEYKTYTAKIVVICMLFSMAFNLLNSAVLAMHQEETLRKFLDDIPRPIAGPPGPRPGDTGPPGKGCGSVGIPPGRCRLDPGPPGLHIP